MIPKRINPMLVTSIKTFQRVSTRWHILILNSITRNGVLLSSVRFSTCFRHRSDVEWITLTKRLFYISLGFLCPVPTFMTELWNISNIEKFIHHLWIAIILSHISLYFKCCMSFAKKIYRYYSIVIAIAYCKFILNTCTLRHT